MNYQKEIENVQKWLKDYLKKSGCKGYVIPISGGIDSAIVATLCTYAVGKRKVMALSLPMETRKDMKEDAQQLANNLGVKFLKLPLSIALTDIKINVKIALEKETSVLTQANIKARLRMVMSYAIANQLNYLVAGTGNKSEDLCGYFTKFGDGGVDILPIYNFYKGEVYEMASLMSEIPDSIKTKAPSADLYPEQTDEDELNIDYPTLDRILRNVYDGEQIDISDIPTKEIERIKTIVKNSEHKNNMPPRCPRL